MTRERKKVNYVGIMFKLNVKQLVYLVKFKADLDLFIITLT